MLCKDAKTKLEDRVQDGKIFILEDGKGSSVTK